MIKVETAASKHVPLLLGALSPAALGEIKALYPEADPASIIQGAIDGATEADAIYKNDDLVCVVGVNNMIAAAYPWVIVHADNVKKYRFEFLNMGKQWVEAACNKYGTLSNIVDAHSVMAIRMLKYMGFTIGSPKQINGRWFRPYYMERK